MTMTTTTTTKPVKINGVDDAVDVEEPVRIGALDEPVVDDLDRLGRGQAWRAPVARLVRAGRRLAGFLASLARRAAAKALAAHSARRSASSNTSPGTW